MGNRRTTFLALAAVLLTLGALWYIHRPVMPQETTLPEVQAEAASAIAASINDAPSVLVNGVEVTDSLDYATIAAAIDSVAP